MRGSGSQKKGFDTVVKPGGDWAARVRALNAHWFYSWGGDTPPGVPAGVEFVPMVWGWYGRSSADWTRKHFAPVTRPDAAPPLLGFNEPDNKGQANLPAARALDAWPTLMETGRRLGSPAAVHADGPWMQEFMREADRRKYRVDFVAVHWYWEPKAASLMGYLEKLHRMYNRPLWLTEFAVVDWSAKTPAANRFTAADVEKFARDVLPALEKAPFVERYAWFSFGQKDAGGGISALFDSAGGLTELGKIYAGF